MGLTSNTALIRATARAAFWQAFEDTPSTHEQVSKRVDSNADQETYPGLFYAPRPRQMSGGRDHRSVPGFNFTIVNTKWESTVDIGYELVKFGKLGAVESLLSSLGQKAKNYPSRLMGDLMNAGDGVVGHDGQNFYGATHVDPGARYTTSQDNDLTSAAATGTTPTNLEMYTALQAHRAAYDGFLDGDGDPVPPKENAKFYVLCSSANMPMGRAVYKNDQLTGPINNDLKGMFEPILNPYSDAGAEFFTVHAGARRPFIYQVAEDVSLTDNMGGDSEFETRDVAFGSFGYYNVGYGEWRSSVRHIFT